jgi:uncharacterized protein YaaN involved in tellurite resistance
MTNDSPQPSTAVGAATPMNLEPARAGQVPALADQFGPEQRVDLSKFDGNAMARVNQIASAVGKLDGRAVNSFGLEPQARANAFLDELMAGIRTSEAGNAGALVAELATGLKMLDIPGMKREAESQGQESLLASLPLIGKSIADSMSAFKRFRANYTLITAHFEKIEEKGRREMASLAAMDSKLDRLVQQNLDSMRELEMYVAAGQVVLDREKVKFRNEREAALSGSDAVALAQARDHGEQINAFETRLLRLSMAMQDALTNVPETRLTQSAGRIEYTNILDTLMFDLPRLKKAILRVAALKLINDASAGSEARRALAQQTAAAGIDMLDKAYTKAKESQSGALAEIAAMGEIADHIVGIIDKGAQIDVKNQASRAEAMRQLEGIKNKFIAGMAQSTANAVRANQI